MEVNISKLIQNDERIIYMIINGSFIIPGDIVEIGGFLGGSTRIFSEGLKQFASHKKLYVIDNFDYRCDNSVNLQNTTSSLILDEQIHKEYRDRDQEEIFYDNIKDCKNIIVLKGDSKEITIPTDLISFAYIDGNHNPDYVENDFYLIWNKLCRNGTIAMHDYGSDLPEVTRKINELVNRHYSEINKIFIYRNLATIFIMRT